MNISGEDVEEIEISYMFADAINDTSNEPATTSEVDTTTDTTSVSDNSTAVSEESIRM